MADAGLPFDGISPNFLDRALGVHGDITPCVNSIESLHDGDAFLLCTDGLWHAMPNTNITARLRAATNTCAIASTNEPIAISISLMPFASSLAT